MSGRGASAGRADACEYCSPADCTGRSLCPAEARYRSRKLTRALRRLLPENISLIHTRQPNPRQKRFREKGGRSDGALRIGDFLILKNAKHPIQRRRKADPEIVSPRRFFAPPFDVKRWHNRLRCQSSLTFGGMTTYIFIKQALRLRFFEPRSSPPPPRGGLLSHSDRRRRTA